MTVGEKEDKILQRSRSRQLMKLGAVLLILASISLMKNYVANAAKRLGTPVNNTPLSGAKLDETLPDETLNKRLPIEPAFLPQPSHQQEIVDNIINRADFKTIESKWCSNQNSNTAFKWISQGDGTLPLGHVEQGIEKRVSC